jgi:hypothetical protein
VPLAVWSYQVIVWLLQFQQHLQPCCQAPAVAEFLDFLEDKVRDWVPFYLRITKDHHDQDESWEDR